MCIHTYVQSHFLIVFQTRHLAYGVVGDSSIDKIIGLFCKRALQKRRFSAKETYNFKEPVIVATPYQSNVILDALG